MTVTASATQMKRFCLTKTPSLPSLWVDVKVRVIHLQVNHSSGLLEKPDPLEQGPYDARIKSACFHHFGRMVVLLT